MTMETTPPRSGGFSGKIGAGLLVIYATLIRGFIFWFERTRLHAVRVSVKTLWLFLTLWILFFALLPLEVESWQLWMTNKDLAKNLAFAIVATSFLSIEVGRIAHEAKRPLVGYYSYGLAALCTLLAVLSGWNYLMHSAEAMRGAAAAQAERSAEMLKQANEDLIRHDKASAERLAILNGSLQKANAGWAPTGTSRLNQSITDYEKQSTAERRELVARVESSRSQAVVAHTDPRPIDVVLGNIIFKGDSSKSSILLDLIRIVFFKAFLLMGLSLAFTPAPESAKKQEKEKLAAERARSMQGADGKFRPRKQAAIPQSENDNNSDWIAPESRVDDKPKKAKSTKKGKRWLDDVFAKNTPPIEGAQFTEEPVQLKAKDDPSATQMFDGLPEDGPNLEDEQIAPIGLFSGDGVGDALPETGAPGTDDFADMHDYVGDIDRVHAESHSTDDESLAHADSSSAETDSDVGVGDVDHPYADPHLGGELSGGDDVDGDGFVDPEGVEAEPAETLLPNNEGVVVWDDEEDPTIKEMLRKTEAAE